MRMILSVPILRVRSSLNMLFNKSVTSSGKHV